MADYLLKMFLLHGFNRSPRFGCTLCTSSQKCRESAAPVLSVRVQPYTSAFRAAAESRAKVHKPRLLRSMLARLRFFFIIIFLGGGRHPALTLCFVLKCTILLHVTTILAKTGNAVVSTPFTDTSIVLEPSATMRTKKRAKARCTLHEARTRTEASAEV